MTTRLEKPRLPAFIRPVIVCMVDRHNKKAWTDMPLAQN
jgi:hypothetical protein